MAYMDTNKIPAPMNADTGRCLVCAGYARDCTCWVCTACDNAWAGTEDECPGCNEVYEAWC